MILQVGPKTLYPHRIPIDPFKGALEGTLTGGARSTLIPGRHFLRQDPREAGAAERCARAVFLGGFLGLRARESERGIGFFGLFSVLGLRI